jgi:hypothetical protein
VHRRDLADVQSAGDGDGLVAEANAEQRPALLDAGSGQADRDARGLRCARSGRDQQSVMAAGQRLADGDGIVALDADVRPERLQIVDQGEGEAVEIVDDQDMRAGQGCLG